MQIFSVVGWGGARYNQTWLPIFNKKNCPVRGGSGWNPRVCSFFAIPRWECESEETRKRKKRTQERDRRKWVVRWSAGDVKPDLPPICGREFLQVALQIYQFDPSLISSLVFVVMLIVVRSKFSFEVVSCASILCWWYSPLCEPLACIWRSVDCNPIVDIVKRFKCM